MSYCYRLLLALFVFLQLTGCYHMDGPGRNESLTSISIPYVQGDASGQLTNELVKQISGSGAFCYEQNGGQLLLKVKVITDGSEKIGYRYDRHGPEGKREKRLMPVEGRRLINAEVSLIRASTEEILVGPIFVKADADYDYYDPDSIRDLTVVNKFGPPQAVINFSLGQLDSIEGAVDDVAVPLYRHLAQHILDGIMSQYEYE
jgi:hypothetical protein